MRSKVKSNGPRKIVQDSSRLVVNKVLHFLNKRF